MYYHASKTGNINILKPSISNHKKEYVYFSDKRENILIYVSNPIEKYCRENNFNYKDKYNWFAPYGFNKDGILCYEEYYPNLLYESYYGVSGYIYHVKSNNEIKPLKDIRNVYVSENPVPVDKIEYIDNVYNELLKEETNGKIKIIRYKDLTEDRKKQIKEIITKDYLENINDLPTKYFYENHFDFLKEYK